LSLRPTAFLSPFRQVFADDPFRVGKIPPMTALSCGLLAANFISRT
jgi:hypothetical protein